MAGAATVSVEIPERFDVKMNGDRRHLCSRYILTTLGLGDAEEKALFYRIRAPRVDDKHKDNALVVFSFNRTTEAIAWKTKCEEKKLHCLVDRDAYRLVRIGGFGKMTDEEVRAYFRKETDVAIDHRVGTSSEIMFRASYVLGDMLFRKIKHPEQHGVVFDYVSEQMRPSGQVCTYCWMTNHSRRDCPTKVALCPFCRGEHKKEDCKERYAHPSSTTRPGTTCLRAVISVVTSCAQQICAHCVAQESRSRMRASLAAKKLLLSSSLLTRSQISWRQSTLDWRRIMRRRTPDLPSSSSNCSSKPTNKTVTT